MNNTTYKPNAFSGNFHQFENLENPILNLNKFGANSIFRLMLSHPYMDHMDSMKTFFETLKPINFWNTKNNKPKSDFGNQKSKYKEEDSIYYQPIRGSKESPKTLYLYYGSMVKYYNEKI